MNANKSAATSFLATLCGCAFLLCPAILCYQAHEWFLTGDWPQLPINLLLIWTGLDRPAVAWFDIQKLLDWILDAPLSLAAAPFGFFCLKLRAQLA